jgi:hypothetical protein
MPTKIRYTDNIVNATPKTVNVNLKFLSLWKNLPSPGMWWLVSHMEKASRIRLSKEAAHFLPKSLSIKHRQPSLI